MDENEVRRKKIENWCKLGAFVAIPLIIAPFTSLILWGILGAGSLVVAGIVGFVLLQLAPLGAMKLANWKMKEIIAEANKNPIETQKNVFIDRTRELAEKAQNIIKFEAGISNFHIKSVGFEKRHPGTPETVQYKQIEEAMRQGLVNRKKQYAIANEALKELDEQIKTAEDIYDMAKEVAGLQTLSAEAEQKVFQEIKLRVSFDAVNNKLNEAVAQLNMEIAKGDDYKALPPASVGDTIPLF